MSWMPSVGFFQIKCYLSFHDLNALLIIKSLNAITNRYSNTDLCFSCFLSTLSSWLTARVNFGRVPIPSSALRPLAPSLPLHQLSLLLPDLHIWSFAKALTFTLSWFCGFHLDTKKKSWKHYQIWMETFTWNLCYLLIFF